jgi:hypothetical protein
MAKKIQIEFDIDSKDVKIVGGELLSLTQQLRVFKKEIQKGDLKPEQFDILRKKIGDTEDQIAKTNTRSKDLFGVLSTLPGPIGGISSSLSGAIDTLKVFSSFSLADIKNSFVDVLDDIKDVTSAFFGLKDASSTVNDIKDNADGLTDSLNGLSDGSSNANDSTQNLTNSLSQTAATAGGTSVALNNVVKSQNSQVDSSGKVVTAQQNMLMATQKTNQTIANTGVVTKGAVAATEGLVVAEKAATFWTTTLGNTIKTVLISTGILAAIVVIGELIALIYSWVSATEDADAANEALNKTLEEQKRLLDIDLKAVDNLTKANITRAKIAGKTEEEIFQITKQGGEDRLKILKEFDEQLIKDRQENDKDLTISEEERVKNRKKINADLLKSNLDIANQINTNDQTLLDEQLRIAEKGRAKQKEINDKKLQQNKEYLSKLKSDTLAGDELLNKLIEENELLRIKDQRQREDQELKNAFQREKNQILKLTINKELEKKLLLQLDTKYALKVAEVADKRNKEDLKTSEEFLQKKFDLITASIDNEILREKVARENQYLRDLAALEQDLSFIASSEEEKFKLRMLLKKAFDNDINVINDKQKQKDKDDATKKLDEELRLLELRSQVLQQGTREYFRNQEELLTKAYEKERILAQGNADLLLEIEKKYQADKKNLKNQEIAAYGEIASATIDSFANLTSAIASSYDEEAKVSKDAFEKRKKILVGGAVMQTASGVINILTSPMPGVDPITMAIIKAVQVAALLTQTGVQIKNIKNAQFEGDAGEGGNRMGRGYEEGGLIGGKRHSQGGTMIEAERGEAIMTRGAVTMFAPMLSMMNQMGGGVSFSSNLSTARPDMPLVSNPSQEQQPLIVKTYVVENEMTSTQQKQARLKDLSTL